MNNIILSLNNVSKNYLIKGFLKQKKICALKNVNFEIYENEIVGLLGLNGAGKTTIIKLICGIISPDEGEIKIFNKTINRFNIEYKKNIGYLPEIPYFYPYFTAEDTIRFYYVLSKRGEAINKERIDEVLKLVNLHQRKNERIKNFSKGMVQKLSIASSLIHNPELLIYDEPTSGLDPISIKDIRNILISLKKEGKTILLSSHSISEVEKICDRVIIIDGGVVKKIIRKEEWEKNELEKIFIDSIGL